MVEALIEGIDDSYDESMSGIYKSDEYIDDNNKVEEARRKLAGLLDDKEQVEALEHLLDMVNNREGYLATAAYRIGIFTGISARETVLGK